MNELIRPYIFCIFVFAVGFLTLGAKSPSLFSGQEPTYCERVITYHANILEEYGKQYPADVLFRIDPIKNTFDFISTIEGMGKIELNGRILSASCNLDLKGKTGTALYHTAKIGSDKDDVWVKIEFVKETLVITLPRKKDSKDHLGKYFVDRYKH